MTSSASVSSTRSAQSVSSTSSLTVAFREKVRFMQSWKPGSVPSNRDKLELYAYHKVAVSGDAPASIPASANAAERAKYNAWRQKSGRSSKESMRLYLQEADRQLRVYGSAVAPIPSTPPTQTPQSTPAVATNTTESALPSSPTPRGLAAIPFLCAAAAESRGAYIRRLAQMSPESGHPNNPWWARQEPLCAPPGSIGALPEYLLFGVAKFLEHVALTTPGKNLVASFCWPLHKSLLVVWVLLILYVSVIRSSLNTMAILVWGSRRTGLSLNREWMEIIPLVAHSISTMCEPHQPLTCRLVGLLVLPFSSLIGYLDETLTDASVALASFSMIAVVVITWWYWLLTVPFFVWMLLCSAFGVGFCFVLIEFAGVQQ